MSIMRACCGLAMAALTAVSCSVASSDRIASEEPTASVEATNTDSGNTGAETSTTTAPLAIATPTAVEPAETEPSSSSSTTIDTNPYLDAIADATFCAELDGAIIEVEATWQASGPADMDPVITNQSAATLMALAPRAPGDVGALLAVAGDVQSALATAAASDPVDQAGLAARMGELRTIFDMIDIDAAEAWAERECGIERLGIQLRLSDDDRTTSAPVEVSE